MNFAAENMLHIENFDLLYGEHDPVIPDFSAVKGDRLIDQARNKAEREVILKVLAYFNNNKTKAAEYLNIARPLLYQKMKRLGINLMEEVEL